MEITIAGELYQVEYVENAAVITPHILQDRPKWITFDSEGTGLHLKKDRPFLWAVAWDGKVFVFPSSPQNLQHFLRWSDMTGTLYAHNTTFDMHMLANGTGDDTFPTKLPRLGDTMGLCRLSFEAISKRDGGDSLALKAVGKKYIDPDSDRYEKQVKAWLKAKVQMDGKVLIAMLKGIGCTKKRLEAMMSGKEPMEQAAMDTYAAWREAYPEPTYQDVPMEIILPYVAVDVILTNILVRKALPVVEHRQQTKVMEMEFRLLHTVYKMEREGIEVDIPYLEEASAQMETVIADLNIRMQELAGGREFTVGQHAVIKQIYTDLLGETPASTDKQFLKKQAREGDELAAIISKLRTLEKWKETYIERILENARYDGRFYSSLGQFNPVSGRFSGDAQQFPKGAIKAVLEEGGPEVEIFRPRRAFIVPNGYYLDYSQVELRYQAHHTLSFGGDLNLCRAYMPYKCIHSVTGEEYRFDTVEQRWRWNEMREGAPTDMHWEDLLKEQWSAWIVPETGEPWVPTDVHSATSIRALQIMGTDPDTLSKQELKDWRDIGKRFNFMRNYGGGDHMAAEVLEIPLEAARAMNKGYTDAFSVVVVYQDKVSQAFHLKGYVKSQSGRRYYLSDPSRFYKGGNYLIQGPCADILKERMIRIDDYIMEHGLGIRMILCVHDEIQFRVPPGEDEHMKAIQNIMQDTPDVLVPIVAEVERTDRYWSDKKRVVDL